MLIAEYRSWVYWCTLYTSSNLGVCLKFFIKKNKQMFMGFPGDSLVKNPPADEGDMGSTPDPIRSHMSCATILEPVL